MSLDDLYDKVRQPIPKSLNGKKRLFEEYRIKKYQGEMNSQDHLVKKEYCSDLDCAIKSQIDRRMLIFTLIAAVAGLVSIVNIIITLMP